MTQKNKINIGAVIKNNLKEVVAGVFMLMIYAPTLIWMWDRWFARDSYYSHGILVPFVTIYLIWQKKDELALIERKESGWGIVFIVFGIIVHILSAFMRVYFTSGFSMLFVLIGLILFFWGRKVFSKIAFPIAFLFFMMPLPMVIITNLSFKLKIFAAQIAAILLNNMGLHAIREGSVIRMRTAQVVVDDVCSGLRSLITLTALGSIFGYWLKGSMFKKVLIFLATIPIAIITNVCRVLILSVISEVWGTQYATGFIHDATGMMVFVLAFILLYAVGKLME